MRQLAVILGMPMIFHSQYAVEVDGGLDQYTTNELIAEINRRMNG